MMNDASNGAAEGNVAAVYGPTTDGMHAVYAVNMPKVRDVFAKLSRRAAKCGLEAPRLVECGKFQERRILVDARGHKETIVHERTWCMVDGVAPVLPGWKLVAVLEHVDGETLTHTLDESAHALPVEYRGKRPVCDHCGTARTRNQTFVVVSTDTGEHRQVGRQCLASFCGSESAARSAIAIASYLSDALDALNDGSEEGSGGSGVRMCDLTEYLSHVVCAVAEFGWTSKKVAEDSCGERLATASRAFASIERLPKWTHYTPGAEDIAKAEAVIAWVLASEDESEYFDNLRVVAGMSGLRAKHEGLAASMVGAYDRAMAEAAERAAAGPSTFVGTVGKRDYFDVQIVRVRSVEGMYGVTHIHVFRDAAGNAYTWFGSSKLDVLPEARFTVKATVKEHKVDRYTDKPTTYLSRVSVEDRPAPKAKRGRKAAEVAS
jgi:hypothetical protein